MACNFVFGATFRMCPADGLIRNFTIDSATAEAHALHVSVPPEVLREYRVRLVKNLVHRYSFILLNCICRYGRGLLLLYIVT